MTRVWQDFRTAPTAVAAPCRLSESQADGSLSCSASLLHAGRVGGDELRPEAFGREESARTCGLQTGALGGAGTSPSERAVVEKQNKTEFQRKEHAPGGKWGNSLPRTQK